MNADQMIEAYSFHCAQCGGRWVEEYEVHLLGEPGARELRVFYRNGFPVSPPRLGVACRTCGGYRVRASAGEVA